MKAIIGRANRYRTRAPVLWSIGLLIDRDRADMVGMPINWDRLHNPPPEGTDDERSRDQ